VRKQDCQFKLTNINPYEGRRGKIGTQMEIPNVKLLNIELRLYYVNLDIVDEEEEEEKGKRKIRRKASMSFIRKLRLSGRRWNIWLRHCSTSRRVAGSIPDGIIGILR
jgi:hypothetical protein